MGLISKRWKAFIVVFLFSFVLLYCDNLQETEKQISANIAVNSILFYQHHISHKLFFKCSYKVTCSEYTKKAIKDKGFFYGISAGWIRINSCF